MTSSARLPPRRRRADAARARANQALSDGRGARAAPGFSCRRYTARVEEAHRVSAALVRSLIVSHRAPPATVRAALAKVPPRDRDAWLDAVLDLDALPDDDRSALPRDCVPYLPCPVDALLRMVDHAGIRSSDVFVDVGSGLGRAAALVHLLTGAAAIGLEIQPSLVLASRALATRLNLSRLSFIEGDAASLAGYIVIGSVFFLNCPFSGERLKRVLAALEPIARTRQLRLCCIHLPLPPSPWLTLASRPSGDLAIYRSADPSARLRVA